MAWRRWPFEVARPLLVVLAMSSRRTARHHGLLLAAGLLAEAPARAEPPRAELPPSQVSLPQLPPVQLQAAGPSPEPAIRYRRLGPARSEPAYLRAALENLGAIAIGTAHYWLNAETNSRDWDFPRWSERFHEANIRFDNNVHVTNNLFHPFAGATYYGLARVNSLSVGESFLYAQASSALWEWGLEWREKVSINDMIMTTAGGTALGEFLVQLAAYLNSAPGETTWAQDVAKATLGLPVWLHDKLEHRRPDPNAPEDGLGFSAAYDHRFTAELQQSWADDAAGNSQVLRGVALDARLGSLPGFREPTAFQATFAEGNFSQAHLDLQFDSAGLREADVKVEAVLAGYYTQQVDPGVTGLLVGLGTALEFVDRDTLAGKDQYGVLHFVGPALDLLFKRPAYELTLGGRAYADFGAIRSLSWRSARAAAPEAIFKSTLEQSYQYHLGASSRLYAELRAHAALLRLEHGYGAYRSIEGVDRFQEDITHDLEASETLEERRVSLAVEPPGTLARFQLGLERLSHQSELGDFRAGRLERRLVLGVGLAF